ncbi:hypothetical protein P3T76_015575 [Phytophthora citrophthora]|uniref:Uncharacterized protein n=1 Tax=Phytophthora citrophthora TaxID=4793 RepID=A0AAD9FZ30_9STRA|nr:hypothetical protein P3T76_015549 [Phytophthora citrophthora]KAK1928921.1 hypothetical protein P3T76_015561 [Phytophthora citrophthora]KAK1928935.1 hypothetical protein P3T76_015575 [Phytophthora citrophthora]
MQIAQQLQLYPQICPAAAWRSTPFFVLCQEEREPREEKRQVVQQLWMARHLQEQPRPGAGVIAAALTRSVPDVVRWWPRSQPHFETQKADLKLLEGPV